MSFFLSIKLKKIKLLLIIFLFISIIFYLLLQKKSQITFTPFITKHIEFDANGDGETEKLIFIENNSKISIEIESASQKHILLDGKNNTFLFDKNPTFNIKINKIDFNRDNIPELILMGYKDSSPITYVFLWDGLSFSNIFKENKNILGILNSHNTRTPILFSSLSSKGDESTTISLIDSFSLRDVSFSNQKIPSLGQIQKFIDIIELTYELSETPGIFSPYIKSEELGLLWNLDKLKYRYSFQMGYFIDTDWDSSSLPTNLEFILSFEQVNYLSNTENQSEFLVKIKTEKMPNGDYLISNINIITNDH